MQILRIFVSSTYKDLLAERAALKAALENLRNAKFSGMEIFGSREEHTKEVCIKEVEHSDYYIGILGSRCGAIAQPEGISLTHLEYRTARNARIPTRWYFKKDPPPDPETEADLGLQEELRAFKAEIDNCPRTYFSDINELVRAVQKDLIDFLQESQFEYLSKLSDFNRKLQDPDRKVQALRLREIEANRTLGAPIAATKLSPSATQHILAAVESATLAEAARLANSELEAKYEALLEQASKKIREPDLEGAEKALIQADAFRGDISNARLNAKFHNNWGCILIRRGEFAAAALKFREARDTDTTEAKYRLNLLTARLSMESVGVDEALTESEQLLPLLPELLYATTVRSRVLAAAGRYDEAKAILRAHPSFDSSHELRFNLGVIDVLSREFESAISDLNAAISLDDRQPEHYCALGDAYALQVIPETAHSLYLWEVGVQIPHGLRLAREAYEVGIRKLGERGQLKVELPSLLNLAGVCGLQRDWQACLDFSEQALEIDPNNLRALSNKASAEIRLGRVDNAVTTLRRAYDLDGANPVISLNLATMLLASGAHEEAVGVLKGVSSSPPSLSEMRSDASFLLCEALLRAGHEDEARATLNDIKKKHGENFYTHDLEALMASIGGNVLAEGEHLETAYKLAPTEFQALHRLAEYYFYKTENFKRAAELYQELLAMGSHEKPHFAHLAVCLFRQNMMTEALEVIRSAEDEDATSAVLVHLKAEILEETGKHEQAYEAYKQYLELEKNSPNALFNFALNCYELDKLDEAITLVSRLRAREEGKDKVLPTSQLSYLYFVKGDLNRAFELAGEALKLVPDDPDAMLRYISIGTKCGKTDDVVPTLASFHEKYPERKEVGALSSEKEIVEWLTAIQESQSRALRFYGDLPFPICFLEQVTPLSLFQLWHRIVAFSSGELQVHLHSGRIRIVEETATARSCQRIAVDPIALLSLSLLGRLDLLAWGFQKIVVPRILLNYIDVERSEPTRRYVSSIRAFLTGTSAVAKLTPRQEGNLPEGSRRVFGELYSQLFDLVEQEGVGLYSDESGIRDIARERNIPTFSTRELLQRAFEDGKLSWDELNLCLVKLARNNYFMVLVSKDNLFHTVQKHSFDMNEDTEALLNGIFAHSPNLEYFSDLFSDFIAKLWAESPPDARHKRSDFLTRCANLISARAGPNRDKLLQKFLGSALVKLIQAAPQEMSSLVDAMYVWIHANLFREFKEAKKFVERLILSVADFLIQSSLQHDDKVRILRNYADNMPPDMALQVRRHIGRKINI